MAPTEDEQELAAIRWDRLMRAMGLRGPFLMSCHAPEHNELGQQEVAGKAAPKS